MRNLRFPKRIASAALALGLTAALALPAAAAEGTLACTYIPITQDGFVAGTMDGVEARYNLSGPTLYCVELVERYYRTVYGLTLRCEDGSITVLNNSDLYFAPTDDPQPGDILYGSAASRGAGYSHWALVRANNGDTLTLFEQNWGWNGQAGIDRVIEFPTAAYAAYTLRSRSGAAVAPAEAQPAQPSTWAAAYIRSPACNGVAQLTGSYLNDVTREDFCRMVLSVLIHHGVTVPKGNDACAAVAQLGLSDNQNGAEILTRQEAAVIAGRLITRIGSLPKGEVDLAVLYADAGAISEDARETVASLSACGLMSAQAGRFNPLGTLTCEQAAELLLQVDNNPRPEAAPMAGSIQAQLDSALRHAARSAAARLLRLDP